MAKLPNPRFVGFDKEFLKDFVCVRLVAGLRTFFQSAGETKLMPMPKLFSSKVLYEGPIGVARLR